MKEKKQNPEAENTVQKFCPNCGVVELEAGGHVCPNCELDFDDLTPEERLYVDDPELGKQADRAEFRQMLISRIIAAAVLILGVILIKWTCHLIFPG